MRITAGQFLIGAVLLSLIAGCGDECDGFTRFTDRNGLIVLVACGEPLPTPTPTTTPTTTRDH